MHFIVSWDLIAEKNYQRLYDGIKAEFSINRKILRSLIYIQHDGPSMVIQGILENYIDSDDRLFVAGIGDNLAWDSPGKELCSNVQEVIENALPM